MEILKKYIRYFTIGVTVSLGFFTTGYVLLFAYQGILDVSDGQVLDASYLNDIVRRVRGIDYNSTDKILEISGSVKFGTTTVLCNSTNKGVAKLSGSSLSLCDGSSWNELGGGELPSQVSPCSGIPADAHYFNNGSTYNVTQLYEGGVWSPSTTATYSVSPTENTCEFTCTSGYTWDGSICIPSYVYCTQADGSCSETEAVSCKRIYDNNGLVGEGTTDGTYWIDPDGTGGDSPFQVYCDMTTDGGGWTRVVGINGGNSSHATSSAVNAVGMTTVSAYGKFSDGVINNIKSDGSDNLPVFRLTCSNVTGYFASNCAFDADSNTSTYCYAESYSFNPPSYGTARYAQSGLTGPADGSHGTADRLIYGAPSLNGCDTTTGWGKSGSLYVR